MSHQTRSFSSHFGKLGALLAMLALSGCVKQTHLPPASTGVIKHHQRIVVRAQSPPWTKANIRVSPGDHILIVASGRVNTHSGRILGPEMAYQSLYMKYGRRGYPLQAVDYDGFKFLRVSDAGRLMFCVRDWTSLDSKGRPLWYSQSLGRSSTSFPDLGKYWYRDNFGSFVVDVFVFSTPDENKIALALDAVVKANPDDHELVSKLGQIVDFKRPSSAATHSKKTNEISPAKSELLDITLYKPQLEEAKDDTTISNQGFLLKSVFQGGHASTVSSVALSPDDNCALSGGKDNTLRLWEVATTREIRVFQGHTDFVNSVAFSPDGKTAVSGSNDDTLRLWEVSTGKEMRIFKGHKENVASVAFSSDGKYVLSGSDDRTLRLWEIATGRQVRVFRGHSSSVASVAFSPDGQYALSGSWDDTLRLWKVSTGREIRVIKGHTDAVTSTAFSPDGKRVLSGSRDSTLRLWEVTTGKQVRVFRGHEGLVTSVTFSPDGQYALSGSRDDTLRLWKVSTGREVRVIEGHTDIVTSATLSSGGEYILSGSRDNTVRLWEISTGRQIGVFKGRKEAITSVAFSQDGKHVLSGGEDSTLQLWDMSTGDQIRVFKGHTDSVNSVLFLPDGKYVLSGSSDKTLRLWEVTTGRQVRVFRGHEDSVTSTATNSDGRFAISASRDGTLRLWEVTTGRQIRFFKDHSHSYAAQSIALSPDGTYALSGGYGRVLRSWNIDSGKEIGVFRGYFDLHTRIINSIAFSPDGNYVVSASGDSTLRLWEANTRKLVRVLRGHTDSVTSVVFSSDGGNVLSGSKDNTLRLWEIKTGRQVRVYRGHEDSVTSVAFSPDGRNVLSGSADGSIKVWNTRSGKKVVTLYHFSNGEWMLTVPDGYYNSSPEGGPLLYWVFHNGLETFTFEQFESFFKRPDIVKARVSGNAKVGRPVPPMTAPPRIDSPDHMAFREINAKTYKLVLTVSALKEVKTVRVFVNGKPTLEVPVNLKEKELSLDVPLFAGANRITAVAYDEKGFSSNPKYVDVICKVADLAKPNLYVFAIGVSNYPNLSPKWQLEFAHTDAKALVDALKNQEGKLFGEVRYNFLSNEKATVDNILKALDALSEISANDVAIIFMAGHGVRSQDGNFYFLTSSGTFSEPQKAGVTWTLLGKYLEKIKGRVILLLDACHSGSIVTETVVPNDELAQQFFSGGQGGVMVFSASKGRQYSLESPDIGGGFGIFTYALTQSLGPRAKEADTNSDGFVEFMELVDYVSHYVHRETKGQQTPWLSRKELFGDLPVAIVN